MAARKTSTATASKPRGARITAAAEVPPITVPPASTVTTGIRSNPVSNPFQNWKFETPGQAQERVQIARALAEEIPFVGYLNRMLIEEAVGDGLVPTSESKDSDFRRDATAYFDQWARSKAVDIRRRFDWYTSQHMIGETVVRDGELMTLKIRDSRKEALARPLSDTSFRALQLQFFTRDQIGNVGTRGFVANGSDYFWDQGVKFDLYHRPITYRIPKQVAKVGAASDAYQDEPAARMMHIFADRAFNQRHGTPWLFGGGSKSALDALDIQSVKKYAAKIRAYFLGAINTPNGEAPASMKNSIRKGVKTNDAGETVDNNLRYIELAGGVSLPVLRKDESITFFQGGEPLTFAELLKEIWNAIVNCYGFPAEYLVNISGLGSGSIRMVLRKVSKALGRIRRFVREQYCQPTWEWVIGDAIDRNLLPAVDDWRSVRWRGGVDPSIDAGRDERSEQEKIRSFTSTVEEYCDASGKDGKAVRHARIDEIADNIAYGHKKHNLPWFLCIDPMTIQAIVGLASTLNIDIATEVAKLTKTEGE